MRASALDAWPASVCGAVVGAMDAPEYVPVSDFSVRSREDFRVDESAALRLERRYDALLGIVISHPSPAPRAAAPEPLLFTPSAAEMAAQTAMAVPFGVIVCTRSVAYKPWWFGDQCPTLPLVGRPFRHGVTDCYSLVRDWARLERGIAIPDFPRDWNWWLKGKDLYTAGFYEAGARSIPRSEAAPGDVILCRVRSKVPNHAVCLMEDGWVAHHFGSFVPYDPKALSRIQRAGRWLRKLGTHALRWHADIPAPR